MALEKINTKTGNATVRKLGHTASNYGGNDINKQRVGYSKRELNVK